MQLFKTSNGMVQIMSAEVLDILYSDTNDLHAYDIKCKILDDTPITGVNSTSVITAKPLNKNNIRLPIKGEIVLLIKAPSSYTTGIRDTVDIYYIDIVSLQNNTHHNSLPSVSSKSSTKINAGGDINSYINSSAGAANVTTNKLSEIDSNFSETANISTLQPYVGDVLYIGRYGNSIRFSSTQKNRNIGIPPNWTGNKPGLPITIIRNSTQKTNNIVTESFKTDDSIIVLSSGQELEFEQSSNELNSINTKKINTWKSDKWGKSPQILISSGRLIFNSTQKEIMLFAKNGIGLSSNSFICIDSKNSIIFNSKKIELGNNATQPIILTNEFFKALGSLVVMSPVGPCTPLSSSPQWPLVQQAVSKIVFTK